MADKCTWVIVADGRIMRCFEEVRRGAALTERVDLEMRHAPADQVTDADRPGRVHESASSARHGMEKGPTPHEEEERRFLARACKAIDKAGEEGLYDQLVIFAPPRALGTIRAELPYVTREKIAATDHVDVVRETADQISERLRNLRIP